MSNEERALTHDEQIELLVSLADNVSGRIKKDKWDPRDVEECFYSAVFKVWSMIEEGRVPDYLRTALLVGNRILLIDILRKTVTRCLIDKYRAFKAQKRGGGDVVHLNDEEGGGIDQFPDRSTPSPEDKIVTDELLAQAAQELEQANIPEKKRKVFLLRLQGYSHKEIAEALGITEGTSRQYYHAAQELYKLYRPELFENEPD